MQLECKQCGVTYDHSVEVCSCGCREFYVYEDDSLSAILNSMEISGRKLC